MASQAHSGATGAPHLPTEVKLSPLFGNTLNDLLEKKVELRAAVRSNFHQIPEAETGVRHRIRIQGFRTPCEFGLEISPIRTERARKRADIFVGRGYFCRLGLKPVSEKWVKFQLPKLALPPALPPVAPACASESRHAVPPPARGLSKRSYPLAQNKPRARG